MLTPLVSTSLYRPRVDWRLRVQAPDTLDFLSERDMKRYRLQRRLIGPTYHPSNLKKYESAVDGVLNEAVARLRSLGGTEVDLKQWMHIITVECLGAVVLSWSPGYIKAETDGGTGSHSYLSWRHKTVYGLFPSAVILNTYSRTVGRLFTRLWGIKYRTPKSFKTFFTVGARRVLSRSSVALLTTTQASLSEGVKANKCGLEAQSAEGRSSRPLVRAHPTSQGQAGIQGGIPASVGHY